MPGQQRVGGDDEPGPNTTGEKPSDPGEHAPVGVGELGSARGSPQHRDLVAKCDHFGFEHPARLGPHDQQLDDTHEQPVREPSHVQPDTGTRWR